MRAIWNIALNDLRVFFKEKGVLIGLIVVPIAMTVAVAAGNGAFASSGPSRVRVDVLDADNSQMSAQFLTDVRAANETLVLCPMDNDDEDFCRLGDDKTLTAERSIERLRDNTALALIEIPAGFEQKIQADEPVSIVYRSNESAVAPGFILQAVQSVVQRMGGAQVAAAVGDNIAESTLTFNSDDDRQAFRQSVYERAAQLWQQNPVTINYQLTAEDPAQSQSRSNMQAGFGQSVPGMGSMFVMFTVFSALYVLIRERANWTMQRLVMMPVSRGQILAGKILMWFLVGMLQYGVVFALGLVLGLNFGSNPVAILLVMAAFTLCTTALAFALSTLLKTEMQANSVSLLLALTLAPLGGAWWPLDVVPPFMRTVGHISPVAWAMEAFNQLIFFQGSLGAVIGNVLVLLALAVVFFAFAVWRFQYD